MSGKRWASLSRHQKPDIEVYRTSSTLKDQGPPTLIPRRMYNVVDASIELRSKDAILAGKIGMSYRDSVVKILNSIASKARESPGAQQIDLVIHFYHKFKIKSGVRTERGRAARALFELVDPHPKNFQELLTNDEFKTDLYNYFSDVEVLKSWTWDKDYSITKGKHVTERSSGILSDSRVLCMHGVWQSFEEADNRMVLHIQDYLRIRKRNKIVVRTVDSDVVVILVSFYPQFLLVDEEIQLIVNFGVANNRRFINIQDLYEKIGKDTSLALPFFMPLLDAIQRLSSSKRARWSCSRVG